jgi:hypothetical protein
MLGLIVVNRTKVLKMTSWGHLADGERLFQNMQLPVKNLQLFVQSIKAFLSEPSLVQNHVYRKKCGKEPGQLVVIIRDDVVHSKNNITHGPPICVCIPVRTMEKTALAPVVSKYI